MRLAKIVLISAVLFTLAGISPAISSSIAPYRNQEGDPIDPYLGWFSTSDTGFTVPDRGLTLPFTRNYSISQNECMGRNDSTMWRYPLGQGWTHAYNLFVDPEWPLGITVDPQGKIGGGGYVTKPDTVEYYDGRGDFWIGMKASGDSLYRMRPGCRFQLRRVKERWALYDEDGTVFKFNREGRLDTLIGADRGKAVCAYDRERNLSAVRTSSGNRFAFKYYFAPGDSHRLWKVYETDDTVSGPYWEYRYRKKSSAGMDILGDVSWLFQLTEVLHHTGGRKDQGSVCYRYYYDEMRRLIVSVWPDTGSGAVPEYAQGMSKGDRLQCWYDSQNRVIYQERVAGRDNSIIRAYFNSYVSQRSGLLDSTRIYYQKKPGGSAHSVTDASFHPGPLRSNYYWKTIRWWMDPDHPTTGKLGIPAWERTYDPETRETSWHIYGDYDSSFQPGYEYLVGPRGDTTWFRRPSRGNRR